MPHLDRQPSGTIARTMGAREIEFSNDSLVNALEEGATGCQRWRDYLASQPPVEVETLYALEGAFCQLLINDCDPALLEAVVGPAEAARWCPRLREQIDYLVELEPEHYREVQEVWAESRALWEQLVGGLRLFSGPAPAGFVRQRRRQRRPRRSKADRERYGLAARMLTTHVIPVELYARLTELGKTYGKSVSDVAVGAARAGLHNCRLKLERSTPKGRPRRGRTLLMKSPEALAEGIKEVANSTGHSMSVVLATAIAMGISHQERQLADRAAKLQGRATR